MTFASLVGNERIKHSLLRALREGRIGQSLLMAGPVGVGKHQFAVALAQALNCERPVDADACGRCLPCRKITRGEHPDVRTILRESRDPQVKKESKSQLIKIDQMREMSAEAQFLPFEGRRKVFIVDDADWMRPDAANAMLKTLEEPPDTSLIILITPKPHSLLETVRSRCLMLSFAPLTPDDIEEHLRVNQKQSADEARLRARIARGSIGRALSVNLAEYRAKRDMILELLETMIFHRGVSDLLSAAEYLGRKLEREEFEHHLDTMLVLLSDLLYLKIGEAERLLTNVDVPERLTRLSEGTTLEELSEWMDRIEKISQALPRNINRQMAMDAMLVSSAESRSFTPRSER